MHIWVASWVTDETDRHGRTVYQHMAFSDLSDAKQTAEGRVRMIVSWDEHRDSAGDVKRAEGMIDGAEYGYGAPCVIERVDVRSPSSFITELSRS